MKFDPGIPAEITKAIAYVMGHVKAVAKTQYNKQGGYNFASRDDIVAECQRRMAEAELAIIQLEVSVDYDRREVPDKDRSGSVQYDKDGKLITKTALWMDATYQFILSCKGETWTHDKARRSIRLQWLGPQSNLAAESYTEKAFTRSLFKLPTGDMDLDAMASADTEEDIMALNMPQKRKSSNGAKKDGTDKIFNEILKAISESINPEMLQHIRSSYAEEWNRLPTRWHEIVEAEYDDKMSNLRGAMV